MSFTCVLTKVLTDRSGGLLSVAGASLLAALLLAFPVSASDAVTPVPAVLNETVFLPGTLLDSKALAGICGKGANFSRDDIHKSLNVILWDEPGKGKKRPIGLSRGGGFGNKQRGSVTVTIR